MSRRTLDASSVRIGWPSRRSTERGVALILAISMLALLLAFVVAAQTSVMGSTRLIKRSAERVDRAQLIDQALSRSRQAMTMTTQSSGQLSLGEDGEAGADVSFERLDSSAGLYASLPGVEGHRDGDASVSITLSGESGARIFLINLSGQRTGAVRIQ